MSPAEKLFVVHNPLLTGLLLWRFARAYLEARPDDSGPDLPKAMIALAVLFHRPSVVAIRGMQKASGLPKALNDEPLIRLGLQERLEAFGPRAFDGINVAAAAGLLAIGREGERWPVLEPALSPKGIPKELKPESEGVADMIKAGDRLGPWFAGFELTTLCAMMRVRF